MKTKNIRLDAVLKNKYLYSDKMNIFKYLYFMFQSIKGFKKYEKSYSFGAQDLIINHFFSNKKDGVYIDVGCYHPIIGSNTYKLFKKGWSGINIDLDFHTIDFFKFYRKNDHNIQIGVSDKKENDIDMYFVHNRSAINSLDKKRIKNATEIRKINVDTLDNIIENSKFKNKKIDFVSIDVEGFETKVLKGFNLKKYSPSIVVIEFIDLAMKKIEFYHQDIGRVINSDIYKHMIKNDYSLVNWLHSDLVFTSNKLR